MPTLRVDFDDIAGFGPAPAGPYKLVLESVTTSVSSQGNPMWVWVFVIAEGLHAGKTIRHYTLTGEGKQGGLKDVCSAFGEAVGTKTINTDDFIGRAVIGELTTRNWKRADGSTMMVNNIVGFTPIAKVQVRDDVPDDGGALLEEEESEIDEDDLPSQISMPY